MRIFRFVCWRNEELCLCNSPICAVLEGFLSSNSGDEIDMKSIIASGYALISIRFARIFATILILTRDIEGFIFKEPFSLLDMNPFSVYISGPSYNTETFI